MFGSLTNGLRSWTGSLRVGGALLFRNLPTGDETSWLSYVRHRDVQASPDLLERAD